jgi:hypothetical protein
MIYYKYFLLLLMWTKTFFDFTFFLVLYLFEIYILLLLVTSQIFMFLRKYALIDIVPAVCFIISPRSTTPINCKKVTI